MVVLLSEVTEYLFSGALLLMAVFGVGLLKLMSGNKRFVMRNS